MQPEPATPGGANPGTRAILECLDRVTDPELDESVVAMGFIDRIDIDGGSVTVAFRLPTFLCSANFAFLMAEDMKVAVEQLPGVTGATVVLKDHFAADRINRGIAGSLPFEAVFSDDASDGLSHWTFASPRISANSPSSASPRGRKASRSSSLFVSETCSARTTTDGPCARHCASTFVATR